MAAPETEPLPDGKPLIKVEMTPILSNRLQEGEAVQLMEWQKKNGTKCHRQREEWKSDVPFEPRPTRKVSKGQTSDRSVSLPRPTR